jgi:hypothetical protein
LLKKYGEKVELEACKGDSLFDSDIHWILRKDIKKYANIVRFLNDSYHEFKNFI